MAQISSILVYGANGYTGRLIVEELKRRGYGPICAGRNSTKVEAVADELQLPHRVFDLQDTDLLAKLLADVTVLLNCAGPFSVTSRQLLEACIRAHTHYLDITGEYEVMEYVASRSADVKAAKIVAMPAVGMATVPSDCLAAYVTSQIPSAENLEIYVRMLGPPSLGVTLESIAALGLPNIVRRNGELKELFPGTLVKTAKFPSEKVSLTSLPWGDISSSFHSTGVPNITVYMDLVPNWVARLSGHLRFALQWSGAQAVLRKLATMLVHNPTERERDASHVEYIAEATDAEGRVKRVFLETKNEYTFTQLSAAEVAIRLAREKATPGFHTPSSYFGADFVLSISGSRRQNLN